MVEPRRILVIEDNQNNRKLVRDVLQFHGHEILEAETAEEGRSASVVKSTLPRVARMAAMVARAVP